MQKMLSSKQRVCVFVCAPARMSAKFAMLSQLAAFMRLRVYVWCDWCTLNSTAQQIASCRCFVCSTRRSWGARIFVYIARELHAYTIYWNVYIRNNRHGANDNYGNKHTNNNSNDNNTKRAFQMLHSAANKHFASARSHSTNELESFGIYSRFERLFGSVTRLNNQGRKIAQRKRCCEGGERLYGIYSTMSETRIVRRT